MVLEAGKTEAARSHLRSPGGANAGQVGLGPVLQEPGLCSPRPPASVYLIGSKRDSLETKLDHVMPLLKTLQGTQVPLVTSLASGFSSLP